MRTLRLPLLLVALTSSLATSRSAPEGFDSDMVLLNLDADPVDVQIAQLEPGLSSGCALIAANPSILADPSLWAPARTEALWPKLSVSVRLEPWNTSEECHAARVTHPDFGTRILFWMERTTTWHEQPVEDISAVSIGTILFGDQPGQAFSDGGAGFVFDATHDLPECTESTGLDWTSPGNGVWTLGEPERVDGCTAWTVTTDADTKLLEVCAPESLLLRPDGSPFRAGDEVDLYADDTAFRMTQVGGKQLELILSTELSRPPYALQYSDGPGTAECATVIPGGLRVGGSLAVATPFDGPTPLELDTPHEVQFSEERDGQVVLEHHVLPLSFVAEPTTIGIGALSWPHTPPR